MEKAKLFKNGQSQAVRLPKALRFRGTEVYANKVGSVVMLVPVDDPWRSLRESLSMFSDDYLEDRSQPVAEQRDRLTELDINPLIVSTDSAIAVDARAVLAAP